MHLSICLSPKSFFYLWRFYWKCRLVFYFYYLYYIVLLIIKIKTPQFKKYIKYTLCSMTHSSCKSRDQIQNTIYNNWYHLPRWKLVIHIGENPSIKLYPSSNNPGWSIWFLTSTHNEWLAHNFRLWDNSRVNN